MTTRHLARPALERLLTTLPIPPRDHGRVHLVVARGVDGRLMPNPGRLTRDGGLEGDRWAVKRKRRSNQVSMMRADVASALGGGQDLSTPGDNLLVRLDLHADNLSPGARLRVGSAILEVTDEAHVGCKLFRQRFGLAALQATLDPAWKPHHLRGIYLQVVEDGEVAPGDAITVLQRP